MPISILPTTNFDFSRLSNPLNNPNNQPIPQQPNDRIITPEIYNNIRQVLLNPPQASQFGSRRNTILAAIGGGAAGFASRDPNKGIEAADYIKNSRYREAYQDWLAKSGALEKGVALDTGLERAKNSGITSLSSLLRTEGSLNPELQGQISKAKDEGKSTTNEKEFKFSESLPEEEKKAFDTYVNKKRSAIERNTSLHLSVKDAREQNIPLTDRDGNPIDTSKLPDNMEYRMFLGGPNGPYFAPDTQMTRDQTIGNQRRTIPVLTPTEPIVEGQARTPTNREVLATDAQGNPVAQELKTTPVNTPIQNNQLPIVQPPIQQNQIQPNIGPNHVFQEKPQPIIEQPKPQSQIVPSQQPNINSQQPKTRPLNTFSSAEMTRQGKYAAPASAAMSQLLGTPNNPNAESLVDFADLMNDKQAKERMAPAIRLIMDGLTNSGEAEGNVGATVMGYGATANTGGFLNYLKNVSGFTSEAMRAQGKVIDDAMAKLTKREQRFVDKLFATYGALSGFRSVLGQSGYKWANEQMRKELGAPGISGSNDSKEFINKIANFAGEINEGIRNSGVSDQRLPDKQYWNQKTQELTKMGLGQTKIPDKKNRYSFEEVK